MDYYDIDTYKMEILAAEPGLNSDAAYEKALLRAVKEAGSYLSVLPDWMTGWPLPGTATLAEGLTMM